MTLRTRIAAVASVSVALAVLAAAIGSYAAVRSDLRGEVDSALSDRARAIAVPRGAPDAGSAGAALGGAPAGAGGADGVSHGSGATHGVSHGSGATYGAGQGGPAGAAPGGDGDFAGQGGPGGPGGLPGSVQPAPFGAASGYVQFVSAAGAVYVPGGQGASPTKIALTAEDRAIAARGTGRALTDRSVKGTELRVLTVGTGARGAVMVARPLTEVENELSHLALVLALIGGGGIVLAGVLGALVARTALAPIGRFTSSTETLTGSLDL